MPLKPYKKPEGRARYLLPQMNFVDPGAEAKTQRPKLPSRGLGVVSIDVDDEIRKRKKADLLRAQLTRGQSRIIDGFLLLDACGVEFPDEGHRADVSGRHATEVSSTDLEYFPNLSWVDASDNPRLPLEDFGSLPRLKDLRFAANSWSVCSSVSEDWFPRLLVLDLSYNTATLDGISQLVTMPRLRDLDLTGNGLVELPDVFSDFQSLEKLFLERNRLQGASTRIKVASAAIARTVHPCDARATSEQVCCAPQAKTEQPASATLCSRRREAHGSPRKHRTKKKMASASYSLPQKILDEMIVDEGPEGRDITGDGTVLFHRTKRRDAPVIGKRHPKQGDECIVRWRERWTDGMNISDGDEPCIVGTQSTHVVGENTIPYEPPGIHDALPLMEIGDTVRLRLHVSKTSNRLEPAACELELVTFYRVDDCDGLKRKVARHNEELYKGITPLADVSVRKSVVEGFSAFKLAAAGALVDAPEGAEAYRGRARDFELGNALNGLCEGDIALVEAGDMIHRLDVERVRPVVDCSEEGDESVLKLEISAPAHSEPAVRGTKGDVKLRVASGLWVIDDEIVGDVECTPSVGAEPQFMALASLSPPLRLAVAKMAVDETAEVTHVDAGRSDDAEARYRVILEGVRNAVDLDDGVAYKVLNTGSKGPCPEPLDDVVVCVEEMDVTTLPLNLTWTLDDDDENVAGAALEQVVGKLRPGERASVDFNGKGPMDSTKGVVTLERIHRRQALIDLKPRQRIERAADMKARGNRAFASRDFAKAVRRYGGGIDAAAKDLEPDLDDEAIQQRRSLASALYLNRAAARLEVKEFKLALSDCDEVLESEPRHAKALYRRGRCCLEMDDWAAAKQAFASVLEVDASNKDARRGLQRVRDAVRRQKALDKARFGGKTVAKGFSEARPAPAAPAVAKPPEPTPANRRSAATAGLVIAGMFVAVAAIGWYGLLG